jgi:hypothetical protein
MIMSYPLMPELGICDLQAVLIHRRTEGSKSFGQSLSLPIFAPALEFGAATDSSRIDAEVEGARGEW